MSYQRPDGTWIPQPGDVWTFDGFIWRPAPPPTPLLVPGGGGGGGGRGARGPAGPAGPPGPSSDVLIQEVYGENQARPTVYSQPAPGGVFATVLTVSITTTVGTYLAIEAALSALTDGGAGSTTTDASIRLLVDGVSLGLGSTETDINATPGAIEPLVALTLIARAPLLPLVLAPGPHTVELQWMLFGDGAANKDIGFVSVDQDGCSMFVREMVQV